MRMRRMGELGKTMEDSAREAMQLLSQLGQGYDEQGTSFQRSEQD